ncbi:hypothetical protein S245_030631, partial [Arachis hypogaea]
MVISKKWSSYKEDNIGKDTDVPTLHLINEMWGSIIKNVKSVIYLYERKNEQESSFFYNVVHSILLREDLTRVSPHQDIEITNERVKCLKRYFFNEEERRKVNIKFLSFSDARGVFDDYDSLNDRDI